MPSSTTRHSQRKLLERTLFKPSRTTPEIVVDTWLLS
jgi:hypothetical protein